MRERARERGTKVAFTLAEVLITLGIIGVVAAITMPILITNMTERKNSERHANIAYKVTQAMEHMRATGKLVQYDSTEAFVNELKKHLKIAKICDKDHIADCWPTETVTDKAGNEFEVSKAKKGKNLSLESETNNVGIVLADGAALILNYNPALTQGLDVGDRVVASNKNLPVGNGKIKNFAYTSSVTGPIDFIMDVNGKGKPNREPESESKQYDIRSLKAASFAETFVCTGTIGSKGCVKYLGADYSAVNCDTTSLEYAGDTICGPTPSDFTNDYWADARVACNAIAGMRLPTQQELRDIYLVRGQYPEIVTGEPYWADKEGCGGYQKKTHGCYIVFNQNYNNTYGNEKWRTNVHMKTICVQTAD